MFSKYPSIEQFRSIVRNVKQEYTHVFNKETVEWEFDPSLKCPTLTFTGTTKAHGTHAGLYFHKDGTITAQKRSGMVTPEKDNYGFAAWLHSSVITEQFNIFKERFFKEYDEFVIYGEWCGGNIQKGVAITGLPKMFIIFDVKLISDGEESNQYLDFPDELFAHDKNIYNVNEFDTYSIDIDFEHPELSIPALQELTNTVENECPIGKYFDVSGVGEGIVWKCKTHKFKVKGEKHSTSKVKKLVSVDVEKLNSVREFVEYAITENRLEQMATEVLNNDFDRANLGKFIKAVSSDVLKEELDTLQKNGLTMKDVGSELSKKARLWFFSKEEI